MFKHVIHIERGQGIKGPSDSLLKKAALAALKSQKKIMALSIRLVSNAEMIMLNKTYRNKIGSTNVLSFPSALSSHIHLSPYLLGDIVICGKVVAHEAKIQHKTLAAHFTHLVIHGVLHLLGFDHIKKHEAVKMESLEITILKTLGFQNPYILLS